MIHFFAFGRLRPVSLWIEKMEKNLLLEEFFFVLIFLNILVKNYVYFNISQ